MVAPGESSTGRGADKRSNVVVIMIVAIVVAAVIGVGVYVVTRDDGGSGTDAATSPAGISKDLFSAWQDGKRSAAALVATPGAVGQIFAIPAAKGDGLEFGGCQKVATEPLPQTCTYTRPGGELAITVGDVQGTTLATAVILGPAATTPTGPG